MMERHILELSESICPNFYLGKTSGSSDASITRLELAILCGSMAHESASFSVGDDGKSLQMEWVQKHQN